MMDILLSMFNKIVAIALLIVLTMLSINPNIASALPLFPAVSICDEPINCQVSREQAIQTAIDITLLEGNVIEVSKQNNGKYIYKKYVTDYSEHELLCVAHPVISNGNCYWIVVLYIETYFSSYQSIGVVTVDAERGDIIETYWEGPMSLYQYQIVEPIIGSSYFWPLETQVLFDDIFIEGFPIRLRRVMPESDELTLDDAKQTALLLLKTYDESNDYTSSEWKIGGECFREYMYDDQMKVSSYKDTWSIAVIYYGKDNIIGYYTYWLSLDAKTGDLVDFEKY